CLKGVQFTGEPSTSGRGRAPVPTLLATHSQGNHGRIAPTKIGKPRPRVGVVPPCRPSWRPTARATTGRIRP
ncbi:hypothetical protein, partial [Prochlorothrix hollandica]|uniref:hypothetical protein n=1 Tax=Prochlorothrix hollandica TaxID=1223 RepID=UPI0009DA64BE